MPLMKSKSKEAFGKNVSAEMDAGKPQKQSLAIAYQTQRAAGSKPKKIAQGGIMPAAGKENYADGGYITQDEPTSHMKMKCAYSDGRYQTAAQHAKDVMDVADPNGHEYQEARRMHDMYAQGGEVTADGDKSLTDSIMAKYSAKPKDDGQALPDDDEPGNNFEELSEDAYKNGDYTAPEHDDYSQDGEKGDEDEKAKGTLVSQIMKKKSKKF